MPTIFFFGSLAPLNLIVSALCTPALNLKQKAEKTLTPFPRAGQFPRPTNDFVRRESLLVNLEFWIIAWPLIHTSSGAINFFSDSHVSRYNFETSEGMLRSILERCPTKVRGCVDGFAQALTQEEHVERTLAESTKPPRAIYDFQEAIFIDEARRANATRRTVKLAPAGRRAAE
jgi:hypothetical protein